MIVSTTEFRKNLSKYLDMAIAGETIMVKRAGVLFQLTPRTVPSEQSYGQRPTSKQATANSNEERITAPEEYA